MITVDMTCMHCETPISIDVDEPQTPLGWHIHNTFKDKLSCKRCVEEYEERKRHEDIAKLRLALNQQRSVPREILFSKKYRSSDPVFENKNTMVWDVIRNFDGQHNLFICGRAGVGKTHAAAYILNEYIENLYSVGFITAAQINQSMRDHSDYKLYCAVRDKVCLVLDDIDKIRASDDVLNWLYLLAEYRKDSTTVITSNLSIDKLVRAWQGRSNEFFPRSIFDRFKPMQELVME